MCQFGCERPNCSVLTACGRNSHPGLLDMQRINKQAFGIARNRVLPVKDGEQRPNVEWQRIIGCNGAADTREQNDFVRRNGATELVKHILAPNKSSCPADGVMFAKPLFGLLVAGSYQTLFVEEGFGVGSRIAAGSCSVDIFEEFPWWTTPDRATTKKLKDKRTLGRIDFYADRAGVLLQDRLHLGDWHCGRFPGPVFGRAYRCGVLFIRFIRIPNLNTAFASGSQPAFGFELFSGIRHPDRVSVAAPQ